jgi:hypothetical protein
MSGFNAPSTIYVDPISGLPQSIGGTIASLQGSIATLRTSVARTGQALVVAQQAIAAGGVSGGTGGTGGTGASASDLAAVSTRVDGNTLDVTNLKTRTTAVEGAVSTQTVQISALAPRISTLENSVTSGASTASVTALATRVTAAESTVATHTTQIGARTLTSEFEQFQIRALNDICLPVIHVLATVYLPLMC